MSSLYTSEAYLHAYSRINAMVIVGEGLADRHFRRLAALLPHDREELRRPGACWPPCRISSPAPMSAAMWWAAW